MYQTNQTAILRYFVAAAAFLFANLGYSASAQAASEVTLAWDRNPESDVAGYRVRSGTKSGNYNDMLDVGNNTTATISNLTSGNTYYFVVSAYNTAGLESQPSAEVSYTTIANQGPVAVDDSVATDEGVPVTISVLSNDSDPDNGPSTLSIQNVGGAANGTTSVAGNGVTYSPAPGFFGTDNFSYMITDGELSASATVTVNVRSTAIADNLLGAGLTGTNIGTGTGSSRVLVDNFWELTGGGVGVSGIADNMHYEYAPQTGDFQALVRIQSLESDGAQAGLMLRESTAAGARFAMIAATPNGFAYGSRTSAGGSASQTAVAGQPGFPDVWVLIQRNGDTIDFAISTDGATFDFAGSTVITLLADEVDLGLFVSSGTPGVSARAVVSDYTVIETVSASNQNGLTAEYYDDMTLTNLKLSRIDATVDFSWGSSSPDPTMPSNNFSARWKGNVEPAYSEIYRFYTVSDDGVRLWVNGTLLIDNWTNHSATEDSGTITLVAGQKYEIVMEYYENGGQATAQLLWSSARQSKQIIPQSALTPETVQNGLTGSYYVGTNFESLALTRIENVDFDWGSGSPDPAVPNDNFSARWVGKIKPRYSETYNFYTLSNNGVRLWVNGKLVIDNWNSHRDTEDVGTITLVAGQKYDIKMEYYEATYTATAKLSWSSPSQSKEIVPLEVLYPDAQ